MIFFYLCSGLLQGLDDHGCLQVSHASGASAGALVAGFLAAGMTPRTMIENVLSINRVDIWDMGGLGGLLKGQLLQNTLEKYLPVQMIEECPIPLGVTAWELFGCRTKIVSSGRLATAIRASCTFPLLFQPVNVDGAICIDGGVFDTSGLMALPGVPESNLIVNVIFSASGLDIKVLPEKYKNARVRPTYSCPVLDLYIITHRVPPKRTEMMSAKNAGNILFFANRLNRLNGLL